MYDKTDFYRLTQAHYTLNQYIESMIYHWYKEKFGERPAFLFEGIIWEDKHQAKVIAVKFSNGDEYEIPIEYFYRKKDYDSNEYPKIKMLWYSDYYDGPLTGLAVFNGKKVWFNCVDESDTNIRSFGIYEISDEELISIEYWHTLFQKYVGKHCDCGDEYASYVHSETFDKYYELSKEAKTEIDCTKNKCLGIFDECHLI